MTHPSLPPSSNPSRRHVLLAAAFGVYAMCASGAQAFQDEGTVRIGSVESLTGVSSPYGIQAINGMKLAIDDINAAGGVTVGGKKVRLQLTPGPDGYDTGADSALTIALLKKQILDDKVLAVVGPTSSQSTEVGFNYLNQLVKEGNPIVLLSPASGGPNLGGISPWGFRNMFFEAQIIDRELALVSKEFGYKKAAVFTVTDNAFTASMAKFVIRPGLEKHGLTVVAEGDSLSRDTDFSRQVQALQRAEPDVVFVSAPVQATVGIMKEAARRGFKPKIWLGTVGSIAPEMPQLGGTAVEGLVIGSSYLPSSEHVKGLTAAYQKRTSSEINLFGVNGYEAAYLLKAGIEAAGIENRPETLTEDRRKLRDALTKVEIKSVTGEQIKFDAKGDTVKQGYLLTVRDGQYVEWNRKPFR